MAYLTIWSYWLRINSQSITRGDKIVASCGQASRLPGSGRYNRDQGKVLSRGSTLESEQMRERVADSDAPCVSVY